MFLIVFQAPRRQPRGGQQQSHVAGKQPPARGEGENRDVWPAGRAVRMGPIWLFPLSFQ